MYPTILKDQIDDLNKNLNFLDKSIKDLSKSSNKLQKWLIFWTIIMAVAVASQSVLIGIQIFG